MSVLKQIANKIISNEFQNAFELIKDSEIELKDDAEYWNLRGLLCLKLNLFDSAKVCLEKAITFDQKNSDIFYNYAYTLENVGMENDAAHYFGLAYLHTEEDELRKELMSKYKNQLETQVIFDIAKKGLTSNPASNNSISNIDIPEFGIGAKDTLSSPIFIGGAGRSGTTLLRVMLNAHPNLCSGPEFKMLQSIAHLYNQMVAMKDIRTAYDLTIEDINNTYASFINSFFQKFQMKNSANRIVEKTPHNVLIMKELIKIFPDARFIHIIRDGRDVASSLVTMNWHDLQGKPLPYVQNIEKATMYWREVVSKSIMDANHPLLEGKVKLIKYEDLIANPEEIMRSVLKFIDEPWSDQVLNYDKVKRGYEPTESSTNQVSKKIHNRTEQRWKKDLTEVDKKIFKEIGGQLLMDLGYESNNAW